MTVGCIAFTRLFLFNTHDQSLVILRILFSFTAGGESQNDERLFRLQQVHTPIDLYTLDFSATGLRVVRHAVEGIGLAFAGRLHLLYGLRELVIKGFHRLLKTVLVGNPEDDAEAMIGSRNQNLLPVGLGLPAFRQMELNSGLLGGKDLTVLRANRRRPWTRETGGGQDEARDDKTRNKTHDLQYFSSAIGLSDPPDCN